MPCLSSEGQLLKIPSFCMTNMVVWSECYRTRCLTTRRRLGKVIECSGQNRLQTDEQMLQTSMVSNPTKRSWLRIPPSTRLTMYPIFSVWSTAIWSNFVMSFTRIAANQTDHTRFRKLFSHAFSDNALLEQEPLLTTYFELLVSKLKEQIDGTAQGRVDMMAYYNFATFDIIGYILGSVLSNSRTLLTFA